MDELQKGLAKKPAARPIQILGVNEAGQEDGNPDMVAGRTLPLLQDIAETDAWSSWRVVYRDVVIVGPTGEKVGAYNLTEHDLGVAANLAALEAKLRAAADAK